MSDLHEYQDVVEAIRSGLNDIRYEEPLPGDMNLASPVRKRRGAPVLVGAAAFALVVGIMTPLVLLSGGSSDAPVGDGETPSVTKLAPPSPVWPPPIPWVAVPEGATWECPAIEAETDTILKASEVPDALRYLPAEEAGTLDAGWGVDSGPACGRSPALVAVGFVDDQRTAARSVIVVWVESPSSELLSPPDVPQTNTVAGGTSGVSSEGGFVVRHRPASGTSAERVDMVGVIDGLPVWIEASGLNPDTVLRAVESMTASSVTGQVELSEDFGSLQVIHTAPVVAEAIDHVIWYLEGETYDIEVAPRPGFNPYAVATTAATFVPVGDTTGVYTREGGGTAQLVWEVQAGTVAILIGAAGADELVRVAQGLVLVGADDPRIPPPPG